MLSSSVGLEHRVHKVRWHKMTLQNENFPIASYLEEKDVYPFHGNFAGLNVKVLLYCAEDFELYALYSIEELMILKKNNDTKHLKNMDQSSVC